MSIPSDFEDECLYARSSWYIHDVLEINIEARRVVALVDTTQLGQAVADQRCFPLHTKHVPGAVAIQLTGTLASLLSAYVLEMRATDGWVGYGTHIHEAKFHRKGEIGPPMRATATVQRKRSLRGTVFITYLYEYFQNDRLVFHSKQTAAWVQSNHRGPLQRAIHEVSS